MYPSEKHRKTNLVTLAIFDIAALELLSSAIFWTYMGAAVCVVIGIYWEKEEFSKEKRHKGWLLLLWALGIETALGVGLHAVDDEISSRQRTVIASQQRTIEQLLSPRRLSSKQREKLAAVAASSKLPFVLMTSPDAETWDFGMSIAGVLKENGWDWQPFGGGGLSPLDGRPAAGATIADHMEIQASPENEAVAHSLAAAIRDPAVIGMADVRVVVDQRIKITTVIAGTKR